jgi:Transposase DDE domain
MRVLAPLLDSLRRCLEGFPDKRRGTNSTYRVVDFGMAAFSAFFMQSPSFLDFQRRLENEHARSNCQTLFDMPKIPTDNQIRDMLDPAEPKLLHPVFAESIAILEGVKGGLDKFQRLGGHVLIALDGTEYFSSNKIHCHNCSTRQRGKGEKEYFHAMLGATLVAPGHDKVIPLQPEFIAPQDGAEKQDCENAAAKRWLAAHGEQYARLNPIYLGDDLFSRQPLCKAVLAVNGHFVFVCKPSSHPLIQEYITGVNLRTHEHIVKRGKQKYVHRYRWIQGIPLRDGEHALKVNWFEIEILNPRGEVTYRNSFITNLAITANNVAELAACGRARWKIENETFNVLKTKGYHIEHNFGHGKQHLASILVTLNLLAFAFHTTCDIADELWRAAREKIGPRRPFFNHLGSITSYLIFDSWQDLLQTLAFAKPPPRPP